MIGLHDQAGNLRIVDTIDGEDMTAWTEIVVPQPGYGEGWMRFDGATLTFVEDWSAFDAALHAGIDIEAGEVRCQYITDVPGQQLTYQHKEREAREWVAATAPSIADYPFLAAEAEATATTPDEAAAAIIAAADEWTAIGAAIEGARIGAKRAVSAAATAADKRAAAVVDWQAAVAPSPGESA